MELRIVAPGGGSTAWEVRVDGLPRQVLDRLAAAEPSLAEWREVLSVRAVESGQPDVDELPALLGRYEVASTGVAFRPRYSPSPGLEIRAHLDGAALDRLAGTRGSPDLVATQLVPESGAPESRVVAVEPGPGEVPANLLRIYVRFSHPMSVRGVPDRVRLLGAGGREIELAFVEVDQGLWDPGHRTLTLFLHPGRVKRGVGPHEALGPVLRPGETVRLRVDADARDAYGRPLVESFEIAWRVAPADRDGPRPERWTILPPTASSPSVRIEFEAPVDRAIAERALRVEADGRAVAAEVRVDADGLGASLTLDNGFSPGPRWELVVAPELEDPSGNRIGRRFEEPVDSAAAPAAARLAFPAPRP